MTTTDTAQATPADAPLGDGLDAFDTMTKPERDQSFYSLVGGGWSSTAAAAEVLAQRRDGALTRRHQQHLSEAIDALLPGKPPCECCRTPTAGRWPVLGHQVAMCADCQRLLVEHRDRTVKLAGGKTRQQLVSAMLTKYPAVLEDGGPESG